MKIRLIFLAMVVGTICNTAQADRNNSAEAVREWVVEGKMLPFETIFQMNRQHLTGKILDLEVEKEDGLIIYEIEQLKDNGEVSEIYIDAVTGKFLKEEAED
jgi:uncharacterized membrane protein YkoI